MKADVRANQNNTTAVTITVNAAPAPASSGSGGGGAVSIGELLALGGLVFMRRGRRVGTTTLRLR